MKNKTIIFYDFEATGVSRDADPISLGMIAVTEKPLFSTRNGYTKDKYTTEIKTFYSEFTDFEIEKCDQWVRENIVDKLLFKTEESLTNARLKARSNLDSGIYKGSKKVISHELKHWLSQFKDVEFWDDFDVIDKPMLIDLIADWEERKDTSLHHYIKDETQEIVKEIADYINDRAIVGEYLEFFPQIKDSQFIKYVKTGLPKHLPNIKYYDFYDLHTLIKKEGFDPDIDRKELAIESIADREKYNQGLQKLGIQESKHNALYDAFLNWKVYEYLNQNF